MRFGHTENQVCAGSYAGALKIWDLEAARLLRTLTGHKASIRAIEFHPYGDFITSGSSDTSVKVSFLFYTFLLERDHSKLFCSNSI